MKLTLLGAVLFASTACGATAEGPPEIQVDRTSCDHCRMLISEPRYAAAYQLPGAPAKTFDDIGCLLEVARRDGASQRRFWFRDAAEDDWITGGEPVFVADSSIRTPMSGGIVAYRTRQAAAAGIERYGGRVVGSLAELLGSKEGGS